MAQLISNFDKTGVKLGLLTQKVDIEDTEHLSKYFVISEYNSVFLAGKNPVAFNGSAYLAPGSEIKIECLDSQGNALYTEQAKSNTAQFTDVSKFVISIHVYAETYNGPGKLVLVGKTKKGEIVRWIGNITIDKTLTNACKVRFYNSPKLEARSLLYPVVDTQKASQEIPPVTYTYPVATANIKAVVKSIIVTNPGSGYLSAPQVVITGAGASGATATAIVENGLVKSITVTDGGQGYKSNPTVEIISGGSGGTGATAEANATYVVSSITVNSGGSGYKVVPKVYFSGVVGVQAAATAVLTGDKVTSIIVDNGGYGYSIAPTVKFDGPNLNTSPDLNIPIVFTASFFSYAVNPTSNTNASVIDKKRTEIDYRVVITERSAFQMASTMFPTGSFNTQMEGSTITFNVKKIKLPNSQKEIMATGSNVVNSTFIIKKVIDSTTIMLNEPFYYQVGKDQLVADIIDATCTSSYDYILYNTNPEANLLYASETSAKDELVKQSYAEITYRNLKTYSGFIARHKLYRRSLFHPGDFQLVSDEPLKSIELLNDIITFNKTCTNIGTFYNQFHTDKYWNMVGDDISITSLASPINSAYIAASPLSKMDGTQYVIVKTDSIDVVKDNVYYPYDEKEFNDLTGKAYNSNFISLKKDSLYIFSTNIIINKDIEDTSAKVSFYFTSSIPTIKTEKNYDPTYGLKIAEISTTDKTSTKYFPDKQSFYFTPNDDYYGTLVVVPYHCNVTLSEVSLKVYGDYGYSPDILFIRIPFDINIPNEAFELKSELYDINSNLVYSDLKINQSFDAAGDSLHSNANGQVITITTSTKTSSGKHANVPASVSIQDNLYLPLIEPIGDVPSRLLGWKFPDGTSSSGQICYTNISKLLTDGDYIALSTVDENGVESTSHAMSVKLIRHLFVDLAGVKHLS